MAQVLDVEVAGVVVAAMCSAPERLPAALPQAPIVERRGAVRALARMPKPAASAVNRPARAGPGLATVDDIVLAERAASLTPVYGTIGLTAYGGLRKEQDFLLTESFEGDLDTQFACELRLMPGAGRSEAPGRIAA